MRAVITFDHEYTKPSKKGERTDEGGSHAAGSEDDGSDDSSPAIAPVLQRPDKRDGHRGARQRDTERQRTDPVCK